MTIIDVMDNRNCLVMVVVNYGMASKVLKEAKNRGVTGGSILSGKGIIQNTVMKFLGIDETKKEIILMVTPKNLGNELCKYLSEKFEFKKKNKGILFTLDINQVRGIKSHNEKTENDLYNKEINTEEKSEGKDKMTNEERSNYEAVFVIVNRGDAKEVVSIATENGARGGTIFHGRGAGIYENSSFFSMAIEPEKEIIMLLIEKEKINNIIEVIEKTMEIDLPGKGIIFTVPVNKTVGLYEGD